MITFSLPQQRPADSWPRHKAKARARRSMRKRVARAAQREREAVAARTANSGF